MSANDGRVKRTMWDVSHKQISKLWRMCNETMREILALENSTLPLWSIAFWRSCMEFLHGRILRSGIPKNPAQSALCFSTWNLQIGHITVSCTVVFLAETWLGNPGNHSFSLSKKSVLDQKNIYFCKNCSTDHAQCFVWSYIKLCWKKKSMVFLTFDHWLLIKWFCRYIDVGLWN